MNFHFWPQVQTKWYPWLWLTRWHLMPHGQFWNMGEPLVMRIAQITFVFLQGLRMDGHRELQHKRWAHYCDVIMGVMASHQPHHRLLNHLFRRISKHQSSVSLAFVRGIHRWPVNSPHKWPVTRKMFPFDDVIMPRLASKWRNCKPCMFLILKIIAEYLISEQTYFCPRKNWNHVLNWCTHIQTRTCERENACVSNISVCVHAYE